MTVQYQGVWSLQSAAQLQSTQRWVTDPLFDYTTLLLQADDAANGAQNNTFLDSSSNNFAITRNGNTTQGSFTPFSPVWSNYFDGTGDYLSIADNAAFEFGSGDFCVELFAYITSVDVEGTIFAGTWNTPNRGWVFGYVAATSEFDFNYSTNGTNSTSTKAVVSLPLNQWVHFAACRSGNTLSTYMNGARIATRDVTGVTIFAPNQALEIGRLTESTSNWDLIGYMSNFRIVKGSSVYNPTQTTINIPTTTLTAITNTTVLTCQSNRFIDSSTNALTVTPNGNVSVQSFSPFAPQFQWTPSVIGGSGYFDGSGDYLAGSVPLSSSTSMSTFTIDGWIYPTTFANAIYPIGDMAPTGVIFVLGVIITTSGNVQLYWFDGAGKTCTSTAVLRLNEWNWFSIVVNSNAITIFVNSTTSGQSGTTTLTTRTQSQNFTIGAYNGSATPAAYLSNLRWSNGIARTISSIPTTPYVSDSNTTLLLNFTNAGIVDATMKNNLETVGNAQISTAVVKYGSGSMYFDGTGDWLELITSPSFSFGTGDFTIEAWFNATTFRALASGGNGIFTAIGSVGLYVGTDAIRITNSGVAVISDITVPLTANIWYHIALTRIGASMRVFLNGVQVGSTITNSTNFNNTGRVRIGTETTETFNGYLDDLRITKGIARYTQNFIPPSVALPRQ